MTLSKSAHAFLAWLIAGSTLFICVSFLGGTVSGLKTRIGDAYFAYKQVKSLTERIETERGTYAAALVDLSGSSRLAFIPAHEIEQTREAMELKVKEVLPSATLTPFTPLAEGQVRRLSQSNFTAAGPIDDIANTLKQIERSGWAIRNATLQTNPSTPGTIQLSATFVVMTTAERRAKSENRFWPFTTRPAKKLEQLSLNLHQLPALEGEPDV
ncbi:MAG: hypothetical protein AAF986_03980 [Pseudomonadota bacterium]